MKEEKDFNDSLKKSLQKSMEKKSKLHNNNYINKNPDNNKIIILNTDININNTNNLNYLNDGSEMKKDINKKDNEKEQRSKSEKSIKLSVLRDLEEAIEEFETEQEPSNNKEGNINTNINKKKNNSNGNENKQIEKKNSVKVDNFLDENKKEKKYINIFKNDLFKESFDIKKKSSIPKNIEKKGIKEDKNSTNKNTEKLKKSFTTTKKPDKDKEKPKEKKSENALIKNIKTNSLTKKKSFKDNNYITKPKDQNNKSIKSIKSCNSNKTKDQDSTSNNTNTNTNPYNTNSFNSNSNSSKSNNDLDKYVKDKDANSSNKKESAENMQIKNTTNNTIKMKNSSKNKTNQNTKKTNTKKLNDKQMPLSAKISINSQKSSSTSKSGEIYSQSSCERNSMKKSKKYKEIEINIEKNNTDFSAIDNPLNVLPPAKKVERNGYYDLNSKDIFDNGSCSNLKINLNIDINSVRSERINGDYCSNINIENIFSDDFESEKNDIDDNSSFFGENRTKKTMIRRGDKKMRAKYPPGKPKSIPRTYNDYCNYDEEGANKICGCIGEQSNGLCFIF
jgi:hypothetical protein